MIVTTDDTPDRELVIRITNAALLKLGWRHGEDDDDTRLIRAAAPTIVDLTLDEVLSAMNEQAEKILGKEDPAIGYTYAMQDKVLSSHPNWVRVATGITRDTDVSAWANDPRFEVQRAMDSLYVRPKTK